MSTEIIQGTPEWFAVRCGKVTASRVADVTAKRKDGKVSDTRETYMGQLIAERLTGIVQESFQNEAMAWGTATEPQARKAYQQMTDNEVGQVGFVEHPTIAGAGCSPDGLVLESGQIEIKCPNSSTHLTTMLRKKTPEKYIKQIQWQLACTGRNWCDFVSYDPRVGEDYALFYHRVPRDPKMIAELELEVVAFLAELEERIADIKKTYGKAAA